MTPARSPSGLAMLRIAMKIAPAPMPSPTINKPKLKIMPLTAELSRRAVCASLASPAPYMISSKVKS